MIFARRLLAGVLPALLLGGVSVTHAEPRGGEGDAHTIEVERSTPNGVDHPLIVQLPNDRRGETHGARPSITNPVPFGRTPAQLQTLLDLSGDGRGETISIVVAFDHPSIVQDVNVFSETFDLPLVCGTPDADPDDCFQFTELTGAGAAVDAGWALETALDVEWAHAIAPRANIILVESASDELPDMMRAVQRAMRAGATVVSNSWGQDEFKGERRYDHICRAAASLCVFAAGNSGNPPAYPAAAPEAIAVSGTTLFMTASGEAEQEWAWPFAGGGVSPFERRPKYQSSVHDEPGRGVPDVSYPADGVFGYSVYTSVPFNTQTGWFKVGGTSAGAPQWGAIFAVANQLRVEGGKPRLSARGYSAHQALYALQGSSALFDVTIGENGECEHCYAGEGYDFVTGLGSPRAGIDEALAAY